MLNSTVITIKTENGDREVFISPGLLQSKVPFDFKSGKLSILYFYEYFRDKYYLESIQKEGLNEKFKSDQYIINYGQDFGQYYLGSFHVDFDTKHYWQWEGNPDKMSLNDVAILGKSLFNPQTKSRRVTMFTPTRPSDFNFSKY